MPIASSRYLRFVIVSPCIIILLAWNLQISNITTSHITANACHDYLLSKPPGKEWVWSELSSNGKQAALSHVTGYLDAFGQKIKQQPRKRWISYLPCNISLVGSKWGAHQLCTELIPQNNCLFISLGISNDFTFDLDLADRWNCHGFAADPTVSHPSMLHRLVSFHNIAAKTLRENDQDKQKTNPWWYASVPSIKKFLNLSHIHVLKMDCEGCGAYLIS
jgi:hypothetical protein